MTRTLYHDFFPSVWYTIFTLLSASLLVLCFLRMWRLILFPILVAVIAVLAIDQSQSHGWSGSWTYPIGPSSAIHNSAPGSTQLASSSASTAVQTSSASQISSSSVSVSSASQTQSSSAATYTNPVYSLVGAADPWVVQYDGYYYMTYTTNDNVTILRSTTLTFVLPRRQLVLLHTGDLSTDFFIVTGTPPK